MTDPEEAKRQQVAAAKRLLDQGRTADYLRGMGFAEGAIIEATKQRPMSRPGEVIHDT